MDSDILEILRRIPNKELERKIREFLEEGDEDGFEQLELPLWEDEPRDPFEEMENNEIEKIIFPNGWDEDGEPV